MTWFLILLLAGGLLALAWFRLSAGLSAGLAGAAAIVVIWGGAAWPVITLYVLAAALLAAAAFRPLRRVLVSNRLLGWFKWVLPPISDTEREALDACSRSRGPRSPNESRLFATARLNACVKCSSNGRSTTSSWICSRKAGTSSARNAS